MPEARADGRLPPLASPVRHALSFDVDPNLARFSGNVRIDVDVPQKTSFIVLHGRNLALTSARIVTARATQPGPEVIPAQPMLRPGKGASAPEELVLAFAHAVSPGRATIELAWDAPFDDELSGLYRLKDGERWSLPIE